VTLTLGTLRRLLRADNPLQALRALAYPRRGPSLAPAPQLTLWVAVGERLPEIPWRLQPQDVFDCATLSCRGMTVATCVTRQLVSEAQRTRDTWRGEAGEFPHCVTERCAQGRCIREALDPKVQLRWKGAGQKGRVMPLRRGAVAQQIQARERMSLAGLLDPVPTIDQGPREAEG
jgi:hypothetical protein